MLKTSWDRLKQEIKSPLAFSGWIIALGFSLYQYAAEPVAEISFKVDQVQIVDFQKINSVPSNNAKTERLFNVLDGNGKKIENNVFGANITVWNSGNLELGADKVRKSVKIDFGDGVSLIDSSLMDVSDENISEISFTSERGSIIIFWKYFDPRSAFKIRVIYASNEKKDISLSGSVLGVKRFNNYDDKLEWKRYFSFTPVIAGFVFGFFIIDIINRPFIEKSLKFRIILTIVFSILLAIFLGFIYGKIIHSWADFPFNQ